ncbi:hypothetical protein [Vibrio alfacsensis]|uniref:hypothetical protein n=1 Tax=Vibrio alfacsensis TaxID=1074311 RepID=UPI0040680DF5
MARRRSKRQQKKQSANTKGVLLIVLSMLILSGIGFAYWKVSGTTHARDKETLCRTDGFVSRETVLVIDKTDVFSKTQSMIVKKEIRKMVENSEVDERFTFYVMSENTDQNIDKLVVCNPSNGSDKNEYTSNVKRLRKRWEENFLNPLLQSLSRVTDEEHTANSSPILEMMKYASINTMYDSEALEKRMVMVSDMLHYTQSFSHYRKLDAYENYKSTPYALEQAPHMDGVDVTILYLSRPKNANLQTVRHVTWWEHHIVENGGMVERVKRVN